MIAPVPPVGPPEPKTLAVRVRSLVTLFAAAVGLVLFLQFFGAARFILLALLASACMAAALRPLLGYVPGPRWLAPVVVGLVPVVVVAGVVSLLSWLIGTHVRAQLEDWPELSAKVDALLASWARALGLGDRLSLRALAGEARSLISHGADVVSTTAQAASGVLLAGMLVFFGSMYLLSEGNEGRMLPALLRAVPPRYRGPVAAAVADLEPRLRWWLIGTLMSMTVVGLASWIGYTLAGVKLAAPLALLAGAAELVPTIGPAVSFLVAGLFALTGGAQQIAGVVAVYLAIQLLESYILLPLIMKRAVHVPPLVTLFTVVLWGKVLGAAGLFLAIPIDLVLWSSYDHLVIRPREAAVRAGSPPAETSDPACAAVGP